MKKLTVLLVVFALLAIPMSVGAQSTTTNTAFQVVNLSQTEEATITITFYKTDGTVAYTITSDTIAAGSSKTYIQSNMEAELGSTFDGSVVIASDQQIAAIVNQNTADASPATAGYNGSYTGFSEGGQTFYIPIVLARFYGYYTEISIQNAHSASVLVNVDYGDTACTDVTNASLVVGTAIRYNNNDNCTGDQINTSAVITADGPVVAIVNQISEGSNLEQTYNGFAPAGGGDTLYAPIALHDYYTFNSSFQVQNISGAAMDIVATYSDGISTTVASVADGDSATFLQGNEAHVANWSGSAKITNSTGGAMVGIVNQQGATSGASYNMYSSGAASWALPSLLYQYYGFTSAFQVQNVGTTEVDITVTYDDGTTATANDVAPGAVAPPFIQNNEAGHTAGWAGSATVTATGGEIVVVVNQDVLTPGAIDYQYSYNAVPLQ